MKIHGIMNFKKFKRITLTKYFRILSYMNDISYSLSFQTNIIFHIANYNVF